MTRERLKLVALSKDVSHTHQSRFFGLRQRRRTQLEPESESLALEKVVLARKYKCRMQLE